MADVPTLKPGIPCPCWSGRKIEDCCGRFGDVRHPQHLPPSRPSRTGIANRRCYAKVLCDCSARLSTEHYISRCVLERIEDSGGVFASGLAWADGEAKKVSAASMGSRVLCSQHNTDLSELDDVAHRLVVYLDEVNDVMKESRQDQHVLGVNGHDVERWLLKALCGLVASKNARHEGVPYPPVVPEAWVRILFGHHVFHGTRGLYVQGRIGSHQRIQSHRVQLAPLTSAGQVRGIMVSLSGFELKLATTDVSPTSSGALDEHTIWRPRVIRFHSDVAESWLCLHWDEGCSDKSINMRWNPTE